MKSYKDYMADKGIPSGPWVVRDSDSDRDGENSRSEVEGEASQNGGVSRIARKTHLKAVV